MAIHVGGRGPGHLARVGGSRIPLMIFGSNLAIWFDNQDPSTMWQDTSATIPAVVGSEVVRQFCKVNPAFYRSRVGTGPTLRQTASGAYYLETTGTPIGMATPAFDLSATDSIGVFTAARKESDAASAVLVEMSASASTNAGSFNITAPASAAANYSFRSMGSISVSGVTASTYAAPHLSVLSLISDISADSLTGRVNGAGAASLSSDQGTGNFGNHVINFLRRSGGSAYFTGREYGFVLCNTTPTAGQITAIETYFNSFTGAY